MEILIDAIGVIVLLGFIAAVFAEASKSDEKIDSSPSLGESEDGGLSVQQQYVVLEEQSRIGQVDEGCNHHHHNHHHHHSDVVVAIRSDRYPN